MWLRYWRRRPDSNWRIKVLQTSALPLGYAALERDGFKGKILPEDLRSGKGLFIQNGPSLPRQGRGGEEMTSETESF